MQFVLIPKSFPTFELFASIFIALMPLSPFKWMFFPPHCAHVPTLLGHRGLAARTRMEMLFYVPQTPLRRSTSSEKHVLPSDFEVCLFIAKPINKNKYNTREERLELLGGLGGFREASVQMLHNYLFLNLIASDTALIRLVVELLALRDHLQHVCVLTHSNKILFIQWKNVGIWIKDTSLSFSCLFFSDLLDQPLRIVCPLQCSGRKSRTTHSLKCQS